MGFLQRAAADVQRDWPDENVLTTKNTCALLSIHENNETGGAAAAAN